MFFWIKKKNKIHPIFAFLLNYILRQIFFSFYQWIEVGECRLNPILPHCTKYIKCLANILKLPMLAYFWGFHITHTPSLTGWVIPDWGDMRCTCPRWKTKFENAGGVGGGRGTHGQVDNEDPLRNFPCSHFLTLVNMIPIL